MRKVFFSFHYAADNWRVSQVRNMHMLEDDPPVSDNEWEQIKKGGELAIKRWINQQMWGRTCTVVLVGAGTANRKWINYEIARAWEEKRGLLGVRIHGLKDRLGSTSSAGLNPFEYVIDPSSQRRLSNFVNLYDPTSLWGSSETYSNIKSNLANWVESAIKQREAQ